MTVPGKRIIRLEPAPLKHAVPSEPFDTAAAMRMLGLMATALKASEEAVANATLQRPSRGRTVLGWGRIRHTSSLPTNANKKGRSSLLDRVSLHVDVRTPTGTVSSMLRINDPSPESDCIPDADDPIGRAASVIELFRHAVALAASNPPMGHSERHRDATARLMTHLPASLTTVDCQVMWPTPFSPGMYMQDGTTSEDDPVEEAEILAACRTATPSAYIVEVGHDGRQMNGLILSRRFDSHPLSNLNVMDRLRLLAGRRADGTA